MITENIEMLKRRYNIKKTKVQIQKAEITTTKE